MKYLTLVVFLATKGCLLDGYGGAITPNADLTITNEYGLSALYVEAWSGTRLEYIGGKVYGNSLMQEVAMTLLPNVAPNNVLQSDLSQEQDLLIVIGEDTGTYIRHINDHNFQSVKKGNSFLIDVTGNIVKQ